MKRTRKSVILSAISAVAASAASISTGNYGGFEIVGQPLTATSGQLASGLTSSAPLIVTLSAGSSRVAVAGELGSAAALGTTMTAATTATTAAYTANEDLRPCIDTFFNFILYGLAAGFVCFLGLVGNSVSIFVLVKDQVRTSYYVGQKSLQGEHLACISSTV